jgi:glycosyltransferase involved in cell wall biosynthesis
MKIGINASFARKENTGIGQVTLNFLRKLSELRITNAEFRNLEFFIYLEEDIDLNLPPNFSKRIFLPLWKRDDLIRKIWWEKYSLPKMAKKDGCDIFLSLYQCPTIMPKSIKHLMIVQDIIPKLFSEYLNNSRKKKYWSLTEKAISEADKIIAISKRTEKDLIQHLGIDPAKIAVSYLDVDEIYKKNVSEEKSAKILRKYKLKQGYIYHGGGLEVRKNTESVIRAYKILLEKFAGGYQGKFPQLVISGKLMPELAPLIFDAENLVKELNLKSQVKFLDFVPQEDLPAIYARALMFIYPSKYEGFGLPILEAMNQGTPVITAKTSSLPEVGGDAVLYCNPDDVYDLVMVMKNVLTNENIRHTLSERSKDRAKNFSWDKFVEKVLNIVENL